MKYPEILAPAGSKEALIGAISSGANAVYLAGKRFGARAFADNFTNEALEEVINYAHMRGVLVYVTINTLVYNDEMDELILYTDFLVKIGVDALIIQDLGVLDLCLKRYPDLDIHVSTQMNTHSVDQVKFLKSLGVKRIVLARETPIENIIAIKKEVDIEVEVFVHGALCVSYSGQCLMSSMMGGRSGNRGECAQPCRLPYTLLKDHEIVSLESYLLSTKDLMTLEYMHALIEAGIDSFKIEGRMRKAYYVIQAVLSYKKARDAYFNKTSLDLEEDILYLTKLFNRSFTKGYLFNELPKMINQNLRPNHMGVEIGEVLSYYNHQVKVKLNDRLAMHDGYRIISHHKDYGNIITRIIKDGALIKSAEKGDVVTIDVKEKIEKGAVLLKTLDQSLEDELSLYMDEHYPVIPLKGICIIKKDQPIYFEVKDQEADFHLSSDIKIEQGLTQHTTHTQVLEKLSRLGDTPCYFESLKIDLEDHLFVPVKILNELRRKMIHDILKARLKRQQKRIIHHDLNISDDDILSEPTLVVKVRTDDQYEAALSMGIKDIYIDYRLKKENPFSYKAFSNIQHISKEIKEPVIISESGMLYRIKEGVSFITDHHFNVTNIYSARLLKSYHPTSITLSEELSKKHLENFHKKYFETFKKRINLEYIVYGRAQLMTTKYCPIAKTFDTLPHCHLCEKNQYALKTQQGAVLPLLHNGFCELNIMQDKPIHLISYIKEILSYDIKRLRLDFTIESYDETKKVIADFQKALTIDHMLKPTTPHVFGRYLG
ncbi:MAG: hypothetical protein CVV61_01540 [Tenericutes bacterium HGW-Tenericutes-6]|jgi:putative protease|nr:MAG: hypothetical protein CVV61_01540 [Tenericutes bacterium HGW-Tenericutes-6]